MEPHSSNYWGIKNETCWKIRRDFFILFSFFFLSSFVFGQARKTFFFKGKSFFFLLFYTFFDYLYFLLFYVFNLFFFTYYLLFFSTCWYHWIHRLQYSFITPRHSIAYSYTTMERFLHSFSIPISKLGNFYGAIKDPKPPPDPLSLACLSIIIHRGTVILWQILMYDIK